MKDLSKKAKEALQSWAKVIAMHVRNEMEDFHCQHLSDAQMKDILLAFFAGKHGFKEQGIELEK